MESWGCGCVRHWDHLRHGVQITQFWVLSAQPRCVCLWAWSIRLWSAYDPIFGHSHVRQRGRHPVKRSLSEDVVVCTRIKVRIVVGLCNVRQCQSQVCLDITLQIVFSDIRQSELLERRSSGNVTKGALDQLKMKRLRRISATPMMMALVYDSTVAKSIHQRRLWSRPCKS